jgi:hypothetical protein
VASATIANARTKGEVHDVNRYWGGRVADLRLALFRPALPQLMELNNDAWLRERRNEQQEFLLAETEK